MKRLTVAVAAVLALVAGCDSAPSGGEPPRTEVFVLVDLSETWNNSVRAARNQRLLGEVGAGLGMAALEAEPPVFVQYRAIGAEAYERDPLCSVEFTPSLISSRNDDPERITRAKNLKQYLSTDCPAFVLSRPPEQRTEILAALRSVSDHPRPREARRRLVVASDFLEESFGGVALDRESFEGVRILLVYRPLAEDQTAPAGTRQRVEQWKALLEAAGAEVVLAPDTGVRRTQIYELVMDRGQ